VQDLKMKSCFQSLLMIVSVALFANSAIAKDAQQAEREDGAVILNNQTLFVVRSKLGPYSPQQRADNIRKKLERVATDPDFDRGSIDTVETDSSTDIVAGDIILMSVTEEDAKEEATTHEDLASRYESIIATALTERRAKESLTSAIEDASIANFTKTLKHLLLEPLSLKIFAVCICTLFVFLLMKVAHRSLGRLVQESSRRYAGRKLISFVAYLLIFILSIVIFRDALGNLAVIVGAATAGIAFALKEVIVSLAGWVALTFGDFYKVGDRVQLGGIKGDVIDIGFARTTLMELGEWVEGDLYTGRIVRVANSFIFTEPMFNYSGDFPYLWDEIKIPVKYGCDVGLTDRILQSIVNDVTADYANDAKETWSKVQMKYLVENARVEPMVTLILNDNWIEFTVRYPVDVKKRRATKDALFRRILSAVEETEGKVGLASATFQLVEAPVFQVNLQQSPGLSK